MTKKNIKPQQTAPVQREINTTSSVDGTGLTPLGFNEKMMCQAFATNDAERASCEFW
ncbi:anacyclamide/piricyclamide family prenylated cyclic peptide [Planktothrix paucivesiculata]|uniref:Anacyclamide/piricyclamide family prenylated cyclic peptide n=1 Tax=Planktothrix paucivesiculata PCC 9631 TaxID=671071 RepID=A0A7Z9BVJ0_9CYAN|nr:anacyclamide/piricyclamide family prenylated cyclic peptide [Planktothrix paucivesiculata]VXD22235.1 hypothetical protein PL9631_650004 [Planktothrix paucivesiculata PCC 9631]